MSLEYIRFIIFIICMGIFIFLGTLLFFSKKYNMKPFSGLLLTWIGSLSLGSIIGVDFLLQGLEKILELILIVNPLWIIVLALIPVNIMLLYQLQRINN